MSADLAEIQAEIQAELAKNKNPKRAKAQTWFFKTAPGQYGQGDIFYGISVPVQHKIAKKFSNLDFKSLEKLLHSKIHEHRLTALFILVEQYKKSDDVTKKKIAKFYLKNKHRVNNWDLVDSSAVILGNYLADKDKSVLYKLAKSKKLWDRRIAIIATQDMIRHGKFSETLKISEILLCDKEDLIHKAVGWMLREIGNKDQGLEEKFLKKHYKKMPRTMLRYAIEKFDQKKRNFYMK
jgi:3-methyladenine DNA glycosylase AlkD